MFILCINIFIYLFIHFSKTSETSEVEHTLNVFLLLFSFCGKTRFQFYRFVQYLVFNLVLKNSNNVNCIYLFTNKCIEYDNNCIGLDPSLQPQLQTVARIQL